MTPVTHNTLPILIFLLHCCQQSFKSFFSNLPNFSPHFTCHKQVSEFLSHRFVWHPWIQDSRWHWSHTPQKLPTQVHDLLQDNTTTYFRQKHAKLKYHLRFTQKLGTHLLVLPSLITLSKCFCIHSSKWFCTRYWHRLKQSGKIMISS